jgi:hypothetical protein
MGSGLCAEILSGPLARDSGSRGSKRENFHTEESRQVGFLGLNLHYNRLRSGPYEEREKERGFQ